MTEHFCYGCSEPLGPDQNWDLSGYIQLCNYCWLTANEHEATQERIAAFNKEWSEKHG